METRHAHLARQSSGKFGHRFITGFFQIWLLQAVLLFAAGCSTLPHAIVTPALPTQPATEKILVISHGWHTGFVVNARDMYALQPALQQRFPAATYLEFGWGDRRFYQSEQFSSGLALRAVLWPTATVMHVVALPADVRRHFPASAMREVCLSPTHLQSLLQFLASSFEQTHGEWPQPLGSGLYGDSAFYSGAGSYHLFNTCNVWTARGLQSAGFDITPSVHVTADSILRFLDEGDNPPCQPASAPD